MNIRIGIDSLSYHCRLESGEITIQKAVEEMGALGASHVQINAFHVRHLDSRQLQALRTVANDLGMAVTLSGDVIGRVGRGDTVADALGRVSGWLETAQLLNSPFLRVASGFYRAELWRQPELIRAEQKYIIESLRAADLDNDTDIMILLENHSDFTPEEYIEIIDSVGSPRVGVFLDVINPVSTLQDPLDVVQRLVHAAPAGHVKDFRLASNYVEDGFHRRGFEVQWCYPGEGVADIPALMKVLADHPSDRPYLLAIEGLDSRAGVDDQSKRLAQCLEYLHGLLATA